MRRLIKLALGVTAAVAVSTASMAFEEQQMKPAAKGAAPAPAASGTAPRPADGGLGIATPELTPPKGEPGTKIRLPGLGVIGEIPKMDFGLELLYGATQPRPNEVERNEPSGFMVRGTVPLKSR